MIYNKQLRIFLIFSIVSTGMIGDVFALDNDEHTIEEFNNKSSIPSQYQDNDSSIETVGPPDSHEAMNNRPIYKNVGHQREKRNFEFLMGLIHNNSRYEITKVDPEKPRQQQQQQPQHEQVPKEMSQEVDSKASASELLLELMVRIAAHPDHWNKVHNLLQKIDNDLITSKRLIENMETVQTKPDGVSINVNKKVENIGTNASEKWPKFDNVENNSDRKVSFVNTLPTDNRWQTTTTMTTNQQQQQQQPPQKHKSIYPKTFAYHRVTGRPLYLNKNPKAYIAVSVIAPKPINERSNNDDLSLEKELRQLKPWTHDQNLQNMATLRSRWVIQNDQHKTNIAP